MSNPYDPNSNPYGAPQGGGYGAPEGGGYGGGSYNPYGAPGGYEQPKKTDAVSIIAFVLSLTCCLSIVGAIMGFIGLSRTKGGQRKGRWAAIAGTIIGIIGTLAAAGIVVVVVFFANSVVDVSEAKVGDCANISSESNDSVLLTKAECGEDHDAEISWVGKVSDVENLPTSVRPTNPDDFTQAGSSLLICTALMDQADVAALGDSVEYQYVTEGTDPTSSSPALCYAAPTSGKFTSKQLP